MSIEAGDSKFIMNFTSFEEVLNEVRIVPSEDRVSLLLNLLTTYQNTAISVGDLLNNYLAKVIDRNQSIQLSNESNGQIYILTRVK